ncbi:cupin domain-containing protein [Congregibacter variabilis]|uniref:Cupin domain-containing protein n=1 Tax=Congregibacter variabilis TaxID=3081200 RepID=A0ABZ0I2B8_9GAMM|nr:cupin domain-containing protein [Congregibacter sp. IMCC43200]
MNTVATAITFLASAARGMTVQTIFASATLLILAQSTTLVAEEDQPSARELIQSLGLEGHVEGGYYRRTYEATNQARIPSEDGERFSMTSIYYLLTAGGPIGHFHRNRSDIVHYFHLGDPIEYVLIHPDGELQTVIMGPDPRKGHHLQLTVAGGVWKASRLNGEGRQGYGLISEAVSPGFDYRDMTLGITSQLLADFPEHRSYIEALSRESAPQR